MEPPEWGRQVRDMRVQAGLTQQQLADEAGVSASTVSRIEQGTTRRPQPLKRAAILDALRRAGAVVPPVALLCHHHVAMCGQVLGLPL